MLEFSPDFYELNGGAKVEQMRTIRQELSKKAFGGNNRVVVITDAHMMNDSAVNAMLKMLEEPPEGTFFCLRALNSAFFRRFVRAARSFVSERHLRRKSVRS